MSTLIPPSPSLVEHETFTAIYLQSGNGATTTIILTLSNKGLCYALGGLSVLTISPVFHNYL